MTRGHGGKRLHYLREVSGFFKGLLKQKLTKQFLRRSDSNCDLKKKMVLTSNKIINVPQAKYIINVPSAHTFQ